MSQILFGIDRLLDETTLLRAQRVGMVTNEAARPARDATVRSRVALCERGVPLVRLFSPEHGLSARAPDGASVGDGIDEVTGLPVVSLYGRQLRPPEESLADLDAVLFDVPDVGSRFYTYIWTLTHVIDACADAGLPLYVLDRPNPISGDLDLCEGPLLDVDRCGSFLGRLAIPIRYGLTSGEVAHLWCAERRPDADVRVISMKGWHRRQMWPELGIPFVATSPAIPSFSAALLYPGTGLFEATNLSLGRGTDRPFQQIGAPWIEPYRLIARVGACRGVQLSATTFRPADSRYAGRECRGIHIRLEVPEDVRPVALSLHLLSAIAASSPGYFRWASYPTAVNPDGDRHFERLIGQAGIGDELTEAGLDPSRIGTLTDVGTWPRRVEQHLIYD